MSKVREKVFHMYNRLSKVIERQQGKYSDKSKQGSILMLVLGVFTLLIILFVSLSSLSLRTYNATKSDIENYQAFLYAKSALKAVVEELKYKPSIVMELVETMNFSTMASSYGYEKEIDVDLYFEGDSTNTVTITAESSYESATAKCKAVMYYEIYEDGTIEISYKFVE